MGLFPVELALKILTVMATTKIGNGRGKEKEKAWIIGEECAEMQLSLGTAFYGAGEKKS